VDISGDVVDVVDAGIIVEDHDLGGVYYDEEEYGEYGAFGGFWTGVVPSDPVVTEGIFVVRVKDETDEDPEDGVWIQLFEPGADVFEDDPLYENIGHIEEGNIVREDANPEGQTAALIATVAVLDLDRGISNSLSKKLNNARDALTTENADQRNDASNKLFAFINAVEAQRGKKIDDADADFLVESALAIIAGIAL